MPAKTPQGDPARQRSVGIIARGEQEGPGRAPAPPRPSAHVPPQAACGETCPAMYGMAGMSKEVNGVAKSSVDTQALRSAAHAAQVALAMAYARADPAGRRSLLDAARCVAKGSAAPGLAQAARGLLALAR